MPTLPVSTVSRASWSASLLVIPNSVCKVFDQFAEVRRLLTGLGLNEAAYMAEIVRAGIQSIPRGQVNAGYALGMNYGQNMRLVILPQAFKIAIPPTVGFSVQVVKSTSLTSIIGFAEAAGFKLAGKSEINANPKDKKDYPKGVWTLPPTLTEGDANRDTYLAIGESDRMTLKFVKPK